jgi:hypothetical protein
MRRFVALLLLLTAFGMGSAGTLAATASAAPAIATATCYPTCTTTPTIDGSTNPLTSQAPSGPATPATPTSATGSLAFTGADIAGTVVIAFVVLGAGLLLVRVSRRRRSVA